MLWQSIEGFVSVLSELLLLNEVKAKSMSMSGKSTFLAHPSLLIQLLKGLFIFQKDLKKDFATRVANRDRRGPTSRQTVTFLNSLYQVYHTLLSIITPVLKIALIFKIFFNKRSFQTVKHNIASFCLGTNASNTP